MKRLFIIIPLAVIFITALILGLLLYFTKYKPVHDELKEVQQQIDSVSNNDYSLLLDKNIVGILEIPKINFKALIKDGTTTDDMNGYVGHFQNTSLFDGNVRFSPDTIAVI